MTCSFILISLEYMPYIYKIGNNWERMVPIIQDGLDRFQSWCVDNCLKLNVKKSKSLVTGTSYKLSGLNVENKFDLNNTPLSNVHTYNCLGILLDRNMSHRPLFARVKK